MSATSLVWPDQAVHTHPGMQVVYTHPVLCGMCVSVCGPVHMRPHMSLCDCMYLCTCGRHTCIHMLCAHGHPPPKPLLLSPGGYAKTVGKVGILMPHPLSSGAVGVDGQWASPIWARLSLQPTTLPQIFPGLWCQEEGPAPHGSELVTSGPRHCNVLALQMADQIN